MTRKTSNQKIRDTLLFSSITLYLIPRFFEYTILNDRYSSLFSSIKTISYLPLLLLIVMNSLQILSDNSIRRVKQNLVIFSLLIFSFFFAFKFGVNSGFVCLGFAFAVMQTNEVRLLSYIQKILIVLLVIGIVFGIGNGNTFYRTIGDSSIRYAFLFTHPYTMQLIWLSIVSLNLLLKKNKTTLTYVVLMSVFTIILQLFGGTRAAFITTVFLLVFNYIIKVRQTKLNTNKKRFFLWKHVFVILFVAVNGYCMYSLNNPEKPLLTVIDYLLTGRISMTVRYIKGVCGSTIPMLPTINSNIDLSNWALSALTLDSDHAMLLFGYGSLYAIVFIVYMDRYMTKAFESENWAIVSVLTAIAINAVAEPCILSIAYNPCILLSFKVLFGVNSTKSNSIRKLKFRTKKAIMRQEYE